MGNDGGVGGGRKVKVLCWHVKPAVFTTGQHFPHPHSLVDPAQLSTL